MDFNLEDFSNNIEREKNPLELDDFKKDYINEIDVDSKAWKIMNPEEIINKGIEVQGRLEECGYYDVESQDRVLRSFASPELLGSFRESIFHRKMQSVNNSEGIAEISLKEVKDQCPIMYETVEMMESRYTNSETNDFMENLHYYCTENGDYILESSQPDSANTRMIVSDNVVYANTGEYLDPLSNRFNECINNGRGVADTTYFIDGRSVYEHDSDGRLVNESTVYKSDFKVKALGEGQEYQNAIKIAKDGIESDESTLSIPRNLGGSYETINQIPISSVIINDSGSEWSSNEKMVMDAVENGDTVLVEHTYDYEGESKRPSYITCSTKIEQVQRPASRFENSSFRDNLITQLDTAMNVEMIGDFQDNVELGGDNLEELDNGPIEEQREDLEMSHIEAPDDLTQVERSAEAIEQIEGSKFEVWKDLSTNGRIEVLQQIENEVSKIACRPSCEVTAQSLGKRYYGYFDPETYLITVNSDYLTSNYEDYGEIIDTIIHEGRHAYQSYNLYGEEVHPSKGDIHNWAINQFEIGYQDVETYGFKDYWMQPVEADARKFAEDIKDRVISAA